VTAPQSVPDVLDAAADYIDQHGWTQGVFDDDEGHVCVREAINRTAPSILDAFRAASALMDAVGDGATNWNDADGRTQDEVTAKLREVAAAQREAAGAS